MIYRAVIAIDPGSVSGAYAFRDAIGNSFVGDLPVAGDGVNARWFYDFLIDLNPDRAYVENVGSRPGQSAPAMWKFAKSVGIIHACLACAGVRTELIAPQKWKGHHSLVGKAADKEVKEKTRALAMRLYPKVHGLDRAKDHNRADALLMLDYALQMENRNDKAPSTAPAA